MKIEKDGKIIYVCECGKEFDKRRAFIGHCSHCEKHLGYKPADSNLRNWAKNKKYTDKYYESRNCQYCGKECKNQNSLKQHELRCKENPNRIKLSPMCEKGHKSPIKGLNKYNCESIQKGIQTYKRNKELDLHKDLCGENNPSKRPEVRNKISESMKKAHKEGRAHNIGESRWNNEPSYPEKWFMEMLKNELDFELNIDYKKEVPFHKFSLDFLFADKKVIEIDGQQHKTNKEQQRRDKEKDRLLTEEGYKELRIAWSDICSNTKSYIQIIKDFILK